MNLQRAKRIAELAFDHLIVRTQTAVQDFFSTKEKISELHALTVCAHYSDYLRSCIANRKYFDSWTVVTLPDDNETIELCKEYGLSLVVTERMHVYGDRFNKAVALNDGLQKIPQTGWVIFLDADVMLPANFRDRINETSFDQRSVYCLNGRLRQSFGSLVEFHRHSQRYLWPKLQKRSICSAVPYDLFPERDWPTGTHPAGDAFWYMMGFFQLFKFTPKIQSAEGPNGVTPYDLLFVLENFDRRHRKYFNVPCSHIGPTGKNWLGRVSSRL